MQLMMRIFTEVLRNYSPTEYSLQTTEPFLSEDASSIPAEDHYQLVIMRRLR